MEPGEINNVSEPITKMTGMDIKHMHNFLVSHIKWKLFRHHPNPFLKKVSKGDGKKSNVFPGLVVIGIRMGVTVPFMDEGPEWSRDFLTDGNVRIRDLLTDGKVRIRPLAESSPSSPVTSE